MPDMHAADDNHDQQHGRGVSEPWNEWFVVEGGASSARIVHYRALRVRRLVDVQHMDVSRLSADEIAVISKSEFPIWLVWSEREIVQNAYWRFDGSFIYLPDTGTRHLTFQQARLELLERLGEWYRSVAALLDTAQSTLNHARDWKDHACVPMPPMGKIGTFDLSGAEHAEAEVQIQSQADI